MENQPTKFQPDPTTRSWVRRGTKSADDNDNDDNDNNNDNENYNDANDTTNTMGVFF